jgi:hypothetical protein
MAVQGLTGLRAQSPHPYVMGDYWLTIESLKNERRHPKPGLGVIDRASRASH